MRINLPNQITIARLFLAVVFCALLVGYDCRRAEAMRWVPNVAFVLFVVGAASDFLDGYLARKRNQETNLGRVLDPFVDKILVVGGFVLFLGTGFVDTDGRNITGVAAWMVVVIVSRELLVSGLRGFSEASGQAYGANVWGKVKMWVQSITVGWIIASLGALRDVNWVMMLRPVMIWIAVGVTVMSAVGYLPASRKALAEPGRD